MIFHKTVLNPQANAEKSAIDEPIKKFIFICISLSFFLSLLSLYRIQIKNLVNIGEYARIRFVNSHFVVLLFVSGFISFIVKK